jgi:hypothetical protein
MSGGSEEFDAATVCNVVCAEIFKRVRDVPGMRSELAEPFGKGEGGHPLLYAIRIDTLDDARHFLVNATPTDYVKRLLITDQHPTAVSMMSSAAAPPLCNMKPAYDHRAGLQMAFRVEVKKANGAGYVVAAFAMGLRDLKYDPVIEVE